MTAYTTFTTRGVYRPTFFFCLASLLRLNSERPEPGRDHLPSLGDSPGHPAWLQRPGRIPDEAALAKRFNRGWSRLAIRGKVYKREIDNLFCTVFESGAASFPSKRGTRAEPAHLISGELGQRKMRTVQKSAPVVYPGFPPYRNKPVGSWHGMRLADAGYPCTRVIYESTSVPIARTVEAANSNGGLDLGR